MADDLWTMLAQAGVRRCYGIVGDALDPTFDAFRRHTDEIEFVHVRHEEWGAFAANAEAFVTGQPVAVCGTAGPGVTHLLNGVLDAFHERCPVIVIAGDIEVEIMGTAYIEEISPEDLFRTGSLYTGRVVSAAAAQTIFAKAIRTAILDRGPTVIALPGDIAHAKAPGPEPTLFLPSVPVPVPSEEDLAAIAELVNGAGKVTIFGGDGCRGAVDSVKALAEKLQAPVGYSLKGKVWLEADNPNAVGMTGLLGYGGCFDALKHADLILMLGTDFPFGEFLQAGDAEIVQVDDRPQMIGRRVPIACGSVADVDAFATALLPLVDAKTDDSHLRHALKVSERWKGELNAYVTHGDQETPIRPQYLAALLNELMDDDAVVTVDVGACCIWAARHIEFSGDRLMFGSFSWASMATASPNAFGASLAHPGRQVVAMCGDGGFSMLGIGDLLTEVHRGANVVHVVFNNSLLDFVNIEMQEVGMVPWATDLPPTNYARIAEGCGATGIRVEDPAELRDAVQRALGHRDGPVVLDVVTDAAALAVPSHVPAKTLAGFTLSMFKQVFGGEAKQVIDEAEHNYKLLRP
ncbi:MAG: thiamine pyrophosphate-binding protein [Actinobacteria bacterium]|nr:thiamine pyrophosphate-binding protein [Actinomycetota bacterium]